MNSTPGKETGVPLFSRSAVLLESLQLNPLEKAEWTEEEKRRLEVSKQKQHIRVLFKQPKKKLSQKHKRVKDSIPEVHLWRIKGLKPVPLRRRSQAEPDLELQLLLEEALDLEEVNWETEDSLGNQLGELGQDLRDLNLTINEDFELQPFVFPSLVDGMDDYLTTEFDDVDYLLDDSAPVQ